MRLKLSHFRLQVRMFEENEPMDPVATARGTVAVLGLLLVACNVTSAPAPRDAAGNYLLPTIEAVSACAGIGTEAVLVGDPADPRVAWLVGSTGKRVDVVFPSGFTARFDPSLEILDSSGKVVGRARDRVDGYCATGGAPLVLLP